MSWQKAKDSFLRAKQGLSHKVVENELDANAAVAEGLQESLSRIEALLTEIRDELRSGKPATAVAHVEPEPPTQRWYRRLMGRA